MFQVHRPRKTSGSSAPSTGDNSAASSPRFNSSNPTPGDKIEQYLRQISTTTSSTLKSDGSSSDIPSSPEGLDSDSELEEFPWVQVQDEESDSRNHEMPGTNNKAYSPELTDGQEVPPLASKLSTYNPITPPFEMFSPELTDGQEFPPLASKLSTYNPITPLFEMYSPEDTDSDQEELDSEDEEYDYHDSDFTPPLLSYQRDQGDGSSEPDNMIDQSQRKLATPIDSHLDSDIELYPERLSRVREEPESLQDGDKPSSIRRPLIIPPFSENAEEVPEDFNIPNGSGKQKKNKGPVLVHWAPINTHWKNMECLATLPAPLTEVCESSSDEERWLENSCGTMIENFIVSDTIKTDCADSIDVDSVATEKPSTSSSEEESPPENLSTSAIETFAVADTTETNCMEARENDLILEEPSQLSPEEYRLERPSCSVVETFAASDTIITNCVETTDTDSSVPEVSSCTEETIEVTLPTQIAFTHTSVMGELRPITIKRSDSSNQSAPEKAVEDSKRSVTKVMAQSTESPVYTVRYKEDNTLIDGTLQRAIITNELQVPHTKMNTTASPIQHTAPYTETRPMLQTASPLQAPAKANAEITKHSWSSQSVKPVIKDREQTRLLPNPDIEQVDAVECGSMNTVVVATSDQLNKQNSNNPNPSLSLDTPERKDFQLDSNQNGSNFYQPAVKGCRIEQERSKTDRSRVSSRTELPSWSNSTGEDKSCSYTNTRRHQVLIRNQAQEQRYDLTQGCSTAAGLDQFSKNELIAEAIYEPGRVL